MRYSVLVRIFIFALVLGAVLYVGRFYCSRYVDGQCIKWHLKSTDSRLLEMAP